MSFMSFALVNARSGSLHEVLSEGEHRVVSRGHFLPTLPASHTQPPLYLMIRSPRWIQDFEEAVVQRLVSSAQDRQVIVFTHRVSLLVQMQEYGKRAVCEPKVTCVRHESWGTGEPGDTPPLCKEA